MGSSHDPRQPAYRPFPPSPRMRWAVVRARIAWPWRIIAGIAGAVAACAAVARFDLGFAARMIPAWLGAALGLWLPGLRLVRVPIEPPRARWAVVRASRKPKPLALAAGFVIGSLLNVHSRQHVPWWVFPLCLVVFAWLWMHRLVRVPVEPTRAPEGLTMRECFNLADAGLDHPEDEWDLDTQRSIDALMREGLVEVETVEMPSARKEDRRG